MRKDPSNQNIKEIISPSTSRPVTASSRNVRKSASSSVLDFAALNPRLNGSARNFRPCSADSTRRHATASSSRAASIVDEFGITQPLPTDIPKPQVPAHVVYDKQVLRFYGQFSESRPWDEDGPLGVPIVESRIVRNVTLYYYLEDGTVSMDEGGATNGMNGGSFFSRSELKRQDGSYIPLKELSVGNTIHVLGQDILIYDADRKTRDYFRQMLKIIMAPAMRVQELGRDDLGVAMATGGGSHFPKKHDPNGSFRTKSSKYEESRESMGKAYAFMHFDEKRLHFEAVLCSMPNEPTDADLTLGTAKRYSISYSLSEKTLDIKPIKEKRSSYDDVKSLLKKSKLAKNWREVNKGKHPIYYQPGDFICGNIIECYGRQLLLTDCDEFTRKLYKDRGIHQKQIVLLAPEIKSVEHPIPQLGDGFLAIGGDEDTLGTVYGMPKPSRDLEKLHRNQGRFMRCKAHLISTNDIDKGREFMVTFYLEDDSLQIYEEVVRNSGLSGGNFLKRGKYLNSLPVNSDEPRYFKIQDFYLGNVFAINGHEMRIVMMDNMSLRFCESYPDEFPMFDTYAIVQKLISKVIKMKIDIRAHMVKYDRARVGHLPKDIFVHVLDDISISNELNDQELLTVMRRFQNNNHRYQYDEMGDLFSQVYFLSVVNKNSAPSSEEEILFNYLRGHKTQLRRLLRNNSHVLNGNITLYHLKKIMKRYGFTLTEENYLFLSERYRIGAAETTKILPKLLAPAEFDAIEDAQIDSASNTGHLPRSPSNCRLDIKSSSRLSKSMGVTNGCKSGVHERRQQILQSVLRKPADDIGNHKTVESDDEKIVISYKTLCDDVYVIDWV